MWLEAIPWAGTGRTAAVGEGTNDSQDNKRCGPASAFNQIAAIAHSDWEQARGHDSGWCEADNQKT